MKLSVSVPDELWESARSVISGDSPSGVVQEALRRATGQSSAGAGYAQPPALPPKLTAALAQTRQRLRDEVRELYQDGYRQGVELASKLTWRQLSWLARTGAVAGSRACSDTTQRIETQQLAQDSGLPDGARPVIDLALLVDYTGSYADYTGHVGWRPAAEQIEGMDQALRDVYDQVRAPANAP